MDLREVAKASGLTVGEVLVLALAGKQPAGRDPETGRVKFEGRVFEATSGA